jgi:hypothetical protein
MSVSLNWVNEGHVAGRGDSDSFDKVFASNAARARQVIHTALQEWQSVIIDLNRTDPSYINGPNAALHNAINLTIQMDTTSSVTTPSGANTHIDKYDANGVPVAATININPFGQAIINPDKSITKRAWFLDPNLWSSAFLGTPTNAFTGYAQAGSKALGQNDLMSIVTHEMGHAVGFDATRSDTGANSPITVHSIDSKTVDNSVGDGKGDYWLFLGPGGFSALLTGYDSGGTGAGVDSHGAGHFAPSDGTWTNPTTKIPYFGADDLMNPGGKSGQRRIVSHEDALVLQYAYGYTIHDPSLSGTFYSVLDETGTLTLRGRQDARSNDGLQLGNTISGGSKAVDTYVQLGNPTAGTGNENFYARSFPLQNVKSINVVTGTALSTVNVSALFAQTPVTITNNGPAVVQIGGDTVAGSVNITNTGAAYTDIIVDNSSSWASRPVNIVQDGVITQISGLTNSTVTWRNVDAGNVTLKTGALTEHVFIKGIAAQSLSVIGNSQPNLTTDPTTYVTFGSGGSMQNINAPTYLWTTSGKFNLTMDDSNDPAGQNSDFGQEVLPASGLRPAGMYETFAGLHTTVHYRVGDLNAPVQIKTGTGFNGFTIRNASAPITFVANSNNTTVYVGLGSLDGILANITVLATPGNSANLVIDDSQVATDRTLTVSRNAVTDLVGLQGGTISFADNALNALTIHASSGNTTVNVNDTPSNIVTTIDRPVRDTGNTSVNVYGTTGPLALGLPGYADLAVLGSSSKTLDTIQGPVAISGGNSPVTASVVVNDSGSPGQHDYTLTANGLTRSGAAPITFATPVRYLGVYARASEVDVQGTPGPSRIFEAQDVYTVNIGAPDNTLNNLGSIYVGGNALINLNDQGATGPETYTFGYYNGYFLATTGTTVTYNAYGTQQEVALNAGDQGNTINVQETQVSAPVTINAGAGVNTINLGDQLRGSTGNTLSYLRESVTINGSGADTLVLNDEGTQTDRNFTLDNGNVSWDGGSVSTSGIANLTLNAGAGTNIFRVLGTLPGTTTTLNGGTGFNEFVVQDLNLTMDSLQGALAAHGQPGSNSFIVLYDYFNQGGQTYTFTVGQVTRTGIAPITYDGPDEVVLYTGQAGGNLVNVQSNAADVFLNLCVATGDTVYIGEPLNDGSGTATLADINGSVGVAAYDHGAPTVIVDNSADTAAHDVVAGQDNYGVYLDRLAPGELYFNIPADQVQVISGGEVTGLDEFFALLGQAG